MTTNTDIDQEYLAFNPTLNTNFLVETKDGKNKNFTAVHYIINNSK